MAVIESSANCEFVADNFRQNKKYDTSALLWSSLKIRRINVHKHELNSQS